MLAGSTSTGFQGRKECVVTGIYWRDWSTNIQVTQQNARYGVDGLMACSDEKIKGKGSSGNNAMFVLII